MNEQTNADIAYFKCRPPRIRSLHKITTKKELKAFLLTKPLYTKNEFCFQLSKIFSMRTFILLFVNIMLLRVLC